MCDRIKSFGVFFLADCKTSNRIECFYVFATGKNKKKLAHCKMNKSDVGSWMEIHDGTRIFLDIYVQSCRIDTHFLLRLSLAASRIRLEICSGILTRWQSLNESK